MRFAEREVFRDGSGHKAVGRLVFNVRQSRLAVQFAGVLRGPDLGGADDVLLSELLLIRPGQRVSGQRGQTIVWITGRWRSWRRKRRRRLISPIHFYFYHFLSWVPEKKEAVMHENSLVPL